MSRGKAPDLIIGIDFGQTCTGEWLRRLSLESLGSIYDTYRGRI